MIDVTDSGAVGRLVAGVLGEAGRIDILVNNAGGVVGQVGRPVEEVADDAWEQVLRVNLHAAFFFIRAVAPAMKAQRHGRIVNISSGAGRSFSLTGIQAYASAKAGQIGLTRQMAKELGAFARALIRQLELSRGRLDRKAASRSLRWLAGALLVLGLLNFVLIFPDLWAARRDLAVGKPWVASSTWGGGCESPLQECPGDGNYFVHTQPENEPWFELDLRSPQTISGVQVVNRVDCCTERAVPLVLEVSTDHKKWREVIRSTQPFREWKASFASVTARWVRLRIPKYGTLHLKRVRILP